MGIVVVLMMVLVAVGLFILRTRRRHLDTFASHQPRVAVCMSGGLRTFEDARIQEALQRHVIDVFPRLGYRVDLFAYINLADRDKEGERPGLRQGVTKEIVETALSRFHPVAVDVMTEEQASKLHPHLLQATGIDRCLAMTEAHGEYDLYFRIRPDFLFLEDVPDFGSLDPEYLHTCAATGKECDLAFCLSRTLYATWWKGVVRPMLEKGGPPEAHEPSGWAIEYWLFKTVQVRKHHDLKGGLLRRGSHVVMWVEKGHEPVVDPSLGLTTEYSYK